MRCSRCARCAPPMAPRTPRAALGRASRRFAPAPLHGAGRARAVLAAGAAEAAVAACGRGEVLDFLPGDGDDGGDHELRDAVAATDADGGTAEVDEQHLDLAPVVGVDRPGRVEERQAVAVRETAARPDLPLVPGRDGHREPRRHEAPLAGAQHDVGGDVGREVHAGRSGRHVARQRKRVRSPPHAAHTDPHGARPHSCRTSSFSFSPRRSPRTVRARVPGRKRRFATWTMSSLRTPSMPRATSSMETSRPK